MKQVFAVVALVLAMASRLQAQAQPDFPVTRAAQPPVIDGVLEDEVWKRAALPLGEWLSYQPNRGDKMPAGLRTEVKIAYDERNIYLAIHCFDDEPAKIRTTISKRDSAFNDDWIAMSLDSAGTGQAAYHLFVNPSGVQMDALNTTASGEQFDADLVWYSVARMVPDGYVVEIQLPLQTLRFSSGDQVRMGLVFFRKISRMGISYSWPPLPPGQWVFDQPAHLLFANLTQPRLVEMLPSVTYGVRQDRGTEQRWNASDSDVNVGASGKFGITSNITFDGTINPDFSQVESDAFQVEVNQRFPIFYSEKRPFFMESMGLFNIAGNSGFGNMRTAVHTRRISNPFWGTKLTGTSGKTTFGVLNALDESPEDIGDRGSVAAERNKLYTIGRATYELRRADYIGAIVTDTEHAGRHNRVVGADLSIKPAASHDVSATFLASQTGVESSDGTHGTAAQASYSYNSRRVTFGTQIERYGREFQMDTAFYNRTGFTAAWAYSEYNFYPRTGTNFWLQRVTPSIVARKGHDDVQDGNEGFVRGALDFSLTRQGHMSFSYGRGYEPWIGRRFDTGGASAFFSGQILRWLNVFSYINYGPEIFYDRVAPFQGHSRSGGFGLTVQPNQNLNQEVGVNMVRFDRGSTGERVYSVDIVNARTTYQFDKHFLVRFLAQYDSSAERVLTDLLASYEFVPGTVFHAGYGSLYEKGIDQIGALRPELAVSGIWR